MGQLGLRVDVVQDLHQVQDGKLTIVFHVEQLENAFVWSVTGIFKKQTIKRSCKLNEIDLCLVFIVSHLQVHNLGQNVTTVPEK